LVSYPQSSAGWSGAAEPDWHHPPRRACL